MKEDYGAIDGAEVELRTADALGSERSYESTSEDDENEQYRKDIIEAMT